jgi:hypothetical protein
LCFTERENRDEAIDLKKVIENKSRMIENNPEIRRRLTGATLRDMVPTICESPVTLPTLARFGAESMTKSIVAAGW